MTDSKSNPSAAAPPPNVQITFRDDVTQPELRQAAERSIATLVARSVEMLAQVRAAEAERAKLITALNGPLAKLIKEDPVAARALKDLRSRQLIDLDSMDVLDSDVPSGAPEIDPLAPRSRSGEEVSVPGADLPLPSRLGPTPLVTEIKLPPYHFEWFWHNADGSPPFRRRLDRPSGIVELDARSGLVEGGASGLVEAHAGFGLVLRMDVPARMTARAHSVMSYSYKVRSLSLGGSATSEGGLEFTALENGQLVSSSSTKLWRKRVSGTEEGAEDKAPFIVGEPTKLEFTMQPGHEYTFNVGIWVLADRETGLGGAAALSKMAGRVAQMTISGHI